MIQLPQITLILPAMAEVLDLEDKSMLTLVTSSFVRKYPDIHLELLASLLQVREDVGRSEARCAQHAVHGAILLLCCSIFRTIAEEAINHAKFHPKGDEEMLKLFEMCKAGGRRALPALEETMQSMFATLVMTTKKTAGAT